MIVTNKHKHDTKKILRRQMKINITLLLGILTRNILLRTKCWKISRSQRKRILLGCHYSLQVQQWITNIDQAIQLTQERENKYKLLKQNKNSQGWDFIELSIRYKTQPKNQSQP